MAKRSQRSGKRDSRFKSGLALGASIVAAIAGGYFLYGPHGKANRKKIEGWALKAKGEVLDEIENMREITEAKYHDTVDKVTKRYARLKKVGEKEAAKLNKELKKHWKHIAAEAQNKKRTRR